MILGTRWGLEGEERVKGREGRRGEIEEFDSGILGLGLWFFSGSRRLGRETERERKRWRRKEEDREGKGWRR